MGLFSSITWAKFFNLQENLLCIQLTEFRYEFQEKLLFRLLTKIKRPQGRKLHLPSLRSRDQNLFNNQNNSRDEKFSRISKRQSYIISK